MGTREFGGLIAKKNKPDIPVAWFAYYANPKTHGRVYKQFTSKYRRRPGWSRNASWWTRTGRRVHSDREGPESMFARWYATHANMLGYGR
ncbi:hypothetical protein BAAM1489_00375 [Bifidobacterium animalis subsp. animalis MCC 1489]|uniref:Uncharacterized protein n=1 Tax=Bifidobacterium animalis subsp. animalis IM386 TaxID=1402194 RepID=A0AAV2W527_9BIFI|nr:hypothetical protein [Bifidobacterium animalis]AFI63039.1 hypothetical protein BANAN_04135 [Bifidobacterium animalis subsp. animalis ATCC 25527]KFI43510.1 hypothetical protein BASA_0913 [Bifidobacterium animalis subsp. animalis]KOA65043.1 hypothetical protein BAAM1489_00375 [Bifidobacterium animalis subsp. animalis MCC 1489]CDI67789.1 Uncharacterized protein BANIM336_01110 [Bifidobacterium animalis subsp. animalis IM386]